MAVTVHAVNFKGLVDSTVTFPLNALTLLCGDSGSGKSTTLRAIRWCFCGKERAVYNHHSPKKPTVVTVSCANWVIERTTYPKNGVRVTSDGDVLEGEEAENWILSRYSTTAVWNMACLQELRSSNPLMHAKPRVKTNILRMLAFMTENSEEYLERTAIVVTEATRELEAAKDTMRTLEETRGDMPTPSPELLKMDMDQLEQRLSKLSEDVARLPTARIAMQQAREEVVHLEAIVKFAQEAAESVRDLDPEEAAAFSKEDYASQWNAAYMAAKEYQTAVQTMAVLADDVTTFVQELIALEAEHGDPLRAMPLTGLPTVKAHQALVDRHSKQEEACVSLGLPCGVDLTQALWESAAEDVSTWNTNVCGIQDALKERTAIDNERRELQATLAELSLPDTLKNFTTTELEEKRQSVTSLYARLKATQAIDLKSDNLKDIMEARVAEIQHKLKMNEHARRWARAQEIFAEVKRLREFSADPEALARVNEQLYEASLQHLKCPACLASLFMDHGELKQKQHSAAVSITALQAERERLEKAQSCSEQCQRLVLDLRGMNLDVNHKTEESLPDDEVNAMTAELHTLRDILDGPQDGVFKLPAAERSWLVASLSTYMDAVKQVQFIKTRAAVSDSALDRLCTVFQVPSITSVESLFESWWTRDGLRVLTEQTRVVVEGIKRFPAFVAPPEYTTALLKEAIRRAELTDTIAKTKKDAETAAARVKGFVLDLPAYPEYDEAALRLPSDLSDIRQINTAVETLQRVRNAVSAKQERYNQKGDMFKQLRSAQEAEERLASCREKSASAQADLSACEEAARLHQAIQNAIPYKRTEARIQEAEKAVAEATAFLAEAKMQRTSALALDGAMLEDATRLLVQNINEILQAIFSTPAVIEFKSTRETKTTKAIRYEMNLLFHYRNHHYDDLTTLSDGEAMRVSWAISLAVAKMNNSPIFAVDEALSTLQPALRMEAFALMREHLPGKALVVVMQDDSLGLFDNVITMNRLQDEQGEDNNDTRKRKRKEEDTPTPRRRR